MKKCTSLLFAALFLCVMVTPTHGEEKKWSIARLQEVYEKRPSVVQDIWLYEADDSKFILYTCKRIQFFFELYPQILAAEQNQTVVNMFTARVLNFFFNEGQGLAISLLRVFDIPQETRAEIPPCGELIEHWDNGIMLTSLIGEIIDVTGINPDSIGSMSNLKKKLVIDIRRTLESLAEAALKDPAKIGEFRKNILKAIKNCGFKSEHLTDRQLNAWGKLLGNVMPMGFWPPVTDER